MSQGRIYIDLRETCTLLYLDSEADLYTFVTKVEGSLWPTTRTDTHISNDIPRYTEDRVPSWSLYDTADVTGNLTPRLASASQDKI